MQQNRPVKVMLLLFLILLVPVISFAGDVVSSPLPSAVSDDQRYNRAIHIMAMLLVGFGFLMVFVRKYGRSALTATFLLVSISLPLYMLGNVIHLNGATPEMSD